MSVLGRNYQYLSEKLRTKTNTYRYGIYCRKKIKSLLIMPDKYQILYQTKRIIIYAFQLEI
jgi:hypothetical protein